MNNKETRSDSILMQFCTVVLLFGFLVETPLAAEELLNTGTSWDGGAIAYPGGDPLVSSYRVLLDQDQETAMHCHPVPTLGYLVSGTLEVKTESGEKLVLQAGQSLVEVMNTVHRGRALNGPVEIIVFYAGAVGVPNTILVEDNTGSESCQSG